LPNRNSAAILDAYNTPAVKLKEAFMRITILFLILSVILAACSGRSHRPIVDFAASPGKTEAMYEQDLSECRQYADAVSTGGSAGRGAAGGAAVGGAMSGLFGAIIGGDAGRSAAAGAAAGGVGGAAGGAASAGRTQEQIINNCMRGRGYSVLR
jgi:hypothetical protein